MIKRNFKLVLLGHYAVGKTSLIARFLNPDSHDDIITSSTIGAAFHTFQHYYTDYNYFNLNIWDTAGQERYRSLTEIYFNGVDVGMIVYDMTNLDSLLEIEDYWLKAFYENRYIKEMKHHDLILFIVGNKSDLYYDSDGNVVNKDLEFGRSKILARIKDKYPLIHFMEVSAKTRHNILELRTKVLDKLTPKTTNHLSEGSVNPNTNLASTITPRRSWCNLL